MNKLNIGIVGYGVVGRATAEALKAQIKAGIYYLDKEKGNTNYQAMCEECEYIFICVPTPTNFHGECDKSIVKEVLTKISEENYKGIVVIKSTIEPLTTAMYRKQFKLNLNFNPEFLSEDTAFEDALKPEVIVIGGKEAEQINKDIYNNDPLSVLTDSTTAEMIKYFFNSLFLLKVVYANQMFDICERLQANYEVVLKAARKHKWVGDMHFKIWDKGYRGASGKCLPKDAKVMANYSPLMEEAIRLNEKYLHSFNKKASYEN